VQWGAGKEEAVDKFKVTVEMPNGARYLVECDKLVVGRSAEELTIEETLTGKRPAIEVVRLSLEGGIKGMQEAG